MEKKFVRVLVRDAQGAILVMAEKREEGLVWNLPGGRVEPGETEAQAAHRELREETGLEVLETELLYQEELPFDGVTWKGSFFEALAYKNTVIIAEPDKCAGYGFFLPEAIGLLNGPASALQKPVQFSQSRCKRFA